VAKILLLGPAREAAGTRHDEVDGATVGDVLRRATERYGSPFAEVLSVSHIWLNGAETDLAQPVGPHDEVAVLPPVSGG
jgi:molybdopterin converting factor small subunit